MAVVAVQPKVCSDPGITAAILLDIMYKAIGKTLLDSDVLYFPLIGISLIGLRIGKKAKKTKLHAQDNLNSKEELRQYVNSFLDWIKIIFPCAQGDAVSDRGGCNTPLSDINI